MYASRSNSSESESNDNLSISSCTSDGEKFLEDYISDESTSKDNLLPFHDTKNPDKVLLNQLADILSKAHTRFREELESSGPISDDRFGLLSLFFGVLDSLLSKYIPRTDGKE